MWCLCNPTSSGWCKTDAHSINFENPKQAFVDYASLRTNEAGGKWFTLKPEQNNLGDTYNPSWKSHPNLRLFKFEADFKQQGEMTNKIDTVLKAITDRIMGTLLSDTVKNLKLNVNSTSPVLFAHSYQWKTPNAQPGDDGDIMFIKIIKKYDDSREEELRENENAATGGLEVEYFDTFLTRSELEYHNYLMCGPIPSLFLRNSIITKGCPSNLKIPCNIRHMHMEKACINLNFPLNIMTRMLCNWIPRRKLDPREDINKGVINFIKRIKVMHIFVGNFTYVADFMIVEDISLIIDPRLSQILLGKTFIKISNTTHDLSLRVVKFTNGINKIAYKMPHKIEQYNSLSDSIQNQSTLGMRGIREEDWST
uniref:MAK10-like protein n=1 Tax=Tanacetum cinerariifolium TaxID=118510 RepID=A0A6L2M4L6_TANCI|nr:MAK10-like protein [Tanacetum cinerariifolium]